jgi:tetratricopeptide (TPR) repeat protein
LSEIVQALGKAQQWERAESVAGRIEEASRKAEALSEIGKGLVEAGQEQEALRVLEEAESVAGRIEEASRKAEALRTIGAALAKVRQQNDFLPFLQRTLLLAETQEYALSVFPLVAHLLVDYPLLTTDFLNSFKWVSAFLGSER